MMMNAIKKSFGRIKEEQKALKNEVRERTVGYIVAALGLVAGLAWNDAIKSTIEYIFRFNSNTILTKFIYSFVVTILIVFVSVYLVRLSNRSNGAQPPK